MKIQWAKQQYAHYMGRLYVRKQKELEDNSFQKGQVPLEIKHPVIFTSDVSIKGLNEKLSLLSLLLHN